MKLLAERLRSGDGRIHGTLPADYERRSVASSTDRPTESHNRAGSRRAAPTCCGCSTKPMQLAADGARHRPPRRSRPSPVDRAARRQFSFSRFTGQLVRHDGGDVAAAAASAATPHARPRSIPAGSARWSTTCSPASTSQPSNRHRIADWCEHLAPQYVVDNADDPVATAAADDRRASPLAALAEHWPPPRPSTAKSSSCSPGRPKGGWGRRSEPAAAATSAVTSTASTKTPPATGGSSTTKPTT